MRAAPVVAGHRLGAAGNSGTATSRIPVFTRRRREYGEAPLPANGS